MAMNTPAAAQEQLPLEAQDGGVPEPPQPQPQPQPPQPQSAGGVLTELLAKTVFVAGLPDEHSVREFCASQFGMVLGVTMVEKLPKSKSWAFVTFENEDDAEEAICAGLSAAVPGREIVVTLESVEPSKTTFDVTLRIESAVEVGTRKVGQLAAHATRMSVLIAGPMVSSEEEQEPDGEGREVTENVRPAFEVGDAVEVHGLVGAAQHNGKQGVVRRFDTAKGRYVLQLPGTEKPLAVKPANLRAAAATDARQQGAHDVDLLIIGAGACGVGCGVMAKRFGVDPARCEVFVQPLPAPMVPMVPMVWLCARCAIGVH
jgi:hypothetical protein